MSLLPRLASLLVSSTLVVSTLAAPALPALAQTPVPATPSPLNGVWHLAGSRELKQFPQLSVSLQLNGSQVYAQGWVQLRCPGTRAGGSGNSFGISGDLNPDGSFTLATPADSRNTNHITINGHIPTATSSTWSGTYRITSASQTCPLDETDGFEASRLDPLTAAFAGSAFNYPGASGNVAFTLTLTQGAAVTGTIRTGAFHFYIPLTATIQVKGSPCFTHGTAEASGYNTLSGELGNLNFTMDDGSQLQTAFVLLDPAEHALDLITAGVKGGKCDGNGFIHGILTRP